MSKSQRVKRNILKTILVMLVCMLIFMTTSIAYLLLARPHLVLAMFDYVLIVEPYEDVAYLYKNLGQNVTVSFAITEGYSNSNNTSGGNGGYDAYWNFFFSCPGEGLTIEHEATVLENHFALWSCGFQRQGPSKVPRVP